MWLIPGGSGISPKHNARNPPKMRGAPLAPAMTITVPASQPEIAPSYEIERPVEAPACDDQPGQKDGQH